AKFYFPGSIPHINFHHWAAGVPLATSIAHKGALAGAKVMAAAVLECLKSPAIVAEAKSTLKDEIRGDEYRPLLPNDPNPPTDRTTRDCIAKRSTAHEEARTRRELIVLVIQMRGA